MPASWVLVATRRSLQPRLPVFLNEHSLVFVNHRAGGNHESGANPPPMSTNRLIILSLLIALAVVPPATAGPGGDPRMVSFAAAWLPQARSNAAVVEWHDHVYVIGGSGVQGPSTSVFDLNPYTRRFTELAPLPSPRFGHGAAVCGTRILVFGGLKDANTYDSDILAYDLRAGTWSNAGTMPFARGRFGLAALGGRVYIAGGNDANGRSAELNVYDPASGAWSRKADLPQARDRLALVALQGMLYAIGGEAADGSASTHVYRYDPNADKWTKISSLARARKNLAAVRLGNRIVVAGGWNVVEDARTFVGAIEMYDPHDRDWLPRGELETPRDGCRAVAWRGHLLIVGGYNGETLSSIEEASWHTFKSAWAIDPRTKLALGSLPREPMPEGVGFTEEKPLPVPSPLPGILPLDLQTARDLGMTPTSDGSAAQSLFIRVFDYPRQLAQDTSARRVAMQFLVSSQGGFGSVLSLLKSPIGVMVSEALFAPSNAIFDKASPFPPLRVPNETVNGVSPQEWFDRTLRYAVMFVRAAEGPKADSPAASVAGAAAFATETMGLLRQTYRSINGPDPAYAYFVDDAEADQAGADPRCSVIRVQKSPTMLANWREIPLAADPAHLFQSGLLRLICDDLVGPQAPDATATVDLKGTLKRTTVLQISTALRVP